MKIKLSRKLLRKILIGTTIFNSLLLVTYVFLLISTYFLENYTVFLLSIPAYVLSNSWMLIVGLFGFEVLLIVYYWFKTKSEVATDKTPVDEKVVESIFDEEILTIDDTEDPIDSTNEELEEPIAIIEPVINNEEVIEADANESIFDVFEDEKEARDPLLIKAEQEFDLLWKEAIEHVRLASTKKKTGASPSIETQEIQPKVVEKKDLTSQNQETDSSVSPLNFDTHSTSRAVIPKSKIKPKKNSNNYSVIKDMHRDFYNELAINNWIYKNGSDRERIGLYKIALEETRFREKDIEYLLDAGIIHKLVIPFHSGPFIIYSIYEAEDKKIISNYLAKFCKQNSLAYNQKSIAFVNYAELGLERKNWRFDFFINNSIVGVIWISNFLIDESQSSNYTLAYKHKKILKALLATSQINFTGNSLAAMIITDYHYNAREIKRYINSMGFGEAQILSIGEKNFEKKLLSASRTEISA
ncbi:MAG: hypothetical protein FK733_16565 [Asgard group archaeon]|nr:hypothetical protein [Asgard group archaeon]